MSQEISYNFRLRKYDKLLSEAIILGYIKPSYEPLWSIMTHYGLKCSHCELA